MDFTFKIKKTLFYKLKLKKMKSIGLLIASSLLICLSVNAQDDNRDKIKIGAKVGFNKSNIYDEKRDELVADSKFGLALGGFVAIPLGTYLGIQPEVMYSQKGFIGKGQIFGNEYNLTRVTNYLDVPLFLTLKPTQNITLLAGPQFSYLLSKKDDFSGPGINIQSEEEFNNDNIRKNTMGVAVGVDISLSNMVLGARASWDLQNNNGDGSSSTPRYKNMLLQATIGFVF